MAAGQPADQPDQPQLAAAVRGLEDSERGGISTRRNGSRACRSGCRVVEQPGLPQVLQPFGKTPIQTVDARMRRLADSIAVANARPSVVKIRGVAQACQKVL